MDSEPTLLVTLITTAVASLLGLVTAFGLDISSGQQSAILTAIGAVYALVNIVWIRSKVYSPKTVEKIAEDAHFAGTIGEPKAKV